MSRIPLALAVAALALVPGLQASGLALPPAPLDAARFDANLADDVATGAARIPVVVRFADAPTEADAAWLLARGFEGPLVRYSVVPAIATAGPASAVRALAANPRVAYAELDEAHPMLLERAALATKAGLVWDALYNASGAVHAGGITGRGVGVAVIDTGVDATHPDLLWKPLADASGLPAKTVANYKMIGRDSIGVWNLTPTGPFLEANALGIDMANTDTTGGHGTHVAGSVGGNGAASGGRFRGAAPGANLVGFGAGETLLVSLGLAALDWVHLHHEEHAIRIVTNSWGGAGEWEPDRAITKAVRRLVNEDGLVVLFAAGNSGGNGHRLETSIWGNIPEVIQVANYYDRTGWLDDSSSRGLRAREDTWPDLAAPGTQIVSTAAVAGPVAWYGTVQDAAISYAFGYGEPTVVPVTTPFVLQTSLLGQPFTFGWYGSMTGTSMATPYVAGVVALLLEANPALDPTTVKAILRATANMPQGRSYAADGFAIGAGVVDAAEAVAVALRMRDGLSLAEALRLSYVDETGSPAKLNIDPPRHLVIDSPAAGATAPGGGTLDVAGRFVPGGQTSQRIPLAPPVPAASIAPAMASAGTVFFADSFEAPSVWSVRNDGFPTSLFTTWTRVNAATSQTWAGAYDGNFAFYAGNSVQASRASGRHYDDLADTSLTSPPIDLTAAESAALSYWRAGRSEEGYDFLDVEVAIEGTEAWTRVDRTSGDILSRGVERAWEESVVDLSAYAGERVQLRFRFTTDELSLPPNLVGWYIDDVRITGVPASGPVVVPTLSASATFGVDALDVRFRYSARANAPVASYALDFGDGSTVHTASTAGFFDHRYGPGEHAATLTVTAGAATATTRILIDVAPSGVVQVRVTGGPWTNAGAAGNAPAAFAATLDLAGVAPGPALVEARHFEADGRGVFHAVDVLVA